MANRLAGSSSPYLQQHADNPVDWHPWGAEAFRKARELRRPVLLSIGYSACHWCHVMARESFSDPVVAEIMNSRFVNVKVDREERPDVDAIYMSALQAMTGSGGWPLTAFLTPEGKPFFAGTYWPDEPRHGLPSFRDVLLAASRAWTENGEAAESTAEELGVHLQQQLQLGLRRSALSRDVTGQALQTALALHDGIAGGFSAAPKFPPHSLLRFLLARPEPAARKAALHTIRHMASGGIFDQLGGGLSRYSVDNAWLVPHFEKMLFDSAQFLGLAASAWKISGEQGYLRSAALAGDWLLREMRRPDGTFMTALSAESAGKEGAFYLWTRREAEAALSGSGLTEEALAAFGITRDGNFEGQSILTLNPDRWYTALDPDLERARQLLFAAREERPRPDIDFKVLTSWNGLAVENLALAGRLLGRDDFTSAADQAAHVFLDRLDAGRLTHSLEGAGPLLLEDLAYLGNGFLGLYQTTLNPQLLAAARRTAELIRDRYSQDGALFSTTAEAELLWRPREQADSGAPADTAEAARLLLRMGRLLSDSGMLELATHTLEASAGPATSQPTLLGSSLAVMDEYLSPATEIVLFGSRDDQQLRALAREVQQRHLPHALLLHESAGDAFRGLLEGRGPLAGQATAYLCQDRSCRLPVSTPDELAAQLPD